MTAATIARRSISWSLLWPLWRFLLHVLQWAIPPVGFVLWRMRVSKRRHAETLAALERQATDERRRADQAYAR